MKKWFYKAGAGITGVLFVASAMTLFAPKAVHAVVSALVTVANTSANPVPVQEVKESRSNFVSVTCCNGAPYEEIQPDGTISSTPFTIPPGEQFVITDVSWIVQCSNSSFGSCDKPSGSPATIRLGGNDQSNLAPYISTAVYAGRPGFALEAGRNESLKSGLVVTQLPLPAFYFGFHESGEFIQAVTLRGYLVP